MINEYSQRKRLTKLGYTTNINELSAFKAEAFMIIETEIDKLEAEERKKAKHGKRRH